jgi:hypothetical protein
MMMKSFRASLAAAAIALVGLAGAGTAAAKPLVPIGPAKIAIKLCIPHFETKVQYVGIKKIGFFYYRLYRVTVIYVDKFCHKRVVRVYYRLVRIPFPFPLPHLNARPAV